MTWPKNRGILYCSWKSQLRNCYLLALQEPGRVHGYKRSAPVCCHRDPEGLDCSPIVTIGQLPLCYLQHRIKHSFICENNVRSIHQSSRGGGGGCQVKGQSSRGGGGGVRSSQRGAGGGVSILRPLAGGMPLAFTQEDFLVTFILGFSQIQRKLKRK